MLLFNTLLLLLLTVHPLYLVLTYVEAYFRNPNALLIKNSGQYW